MTSAFELQPNACLTRCCLQFKHKARQKQRQQSLNQLAEPGSNSGSGKAADNIVINQMVQKKLPAIKRRRLERQQDDASLLQDYRHFKKLKAGQISEVEHFVTAHLL